MRSWLLAVLLAFCRPLFAQEELPEALQLDDSLSPTAAITVPHCVSGLGQYSASVPSTPGHSYFWTITGGGSIVSGQNTASMTFNAGPPANQMTISVAETWTGCALTTSDTLETNFLDVTGGQFYNYICAIARRGITVGCGSGYYCAASPVTRGQMAVYLGKSEHTAAWTPDPCAGIFSDVPCSRPDAPWIEQLYRELITAGCGTDTHGKPIYCPDSNVTRAQMAVFLIKMSHNPYIPPPAACGCVYNDVPAGSFAANFIEVLAADQHVAPGNCGAGKYCPNDATLREQMAEFVALTFKLTVP